MGIPASELTQLRADAATFLDTPCVATRNTSSTPDVYGGLGSTPETVFTGNCSLSRPTTGQMQQYASRVGDLVTWTIKLPYGTNLLRGDLVTLSATGEQLLVQGIMDPHSFASLDLILCTEVR